MLRWRSVRTMDRPATWVYVVAVRALRRQMARRRTDADPVPDAPTASADASTGVVTAAVVASALAALPPRQRLAVVLRFHGDLSVPEIARAMRCSQGTVKSTLHAALVRLRVDLGDTDLEGANDAR